MAIVAIVAFNVNLNIQNCSLQANLHDIEALGREITGGDRAIKGSIITCRYWGKDPETGESCYIEFEATQIDCPPGGMFCTPSYPC